MNNVLVVTLIALLSAGIMTEAGAFTMLAFWFVLACIGYLGHQLNITEGKECGRSNSEDQKEKG